MSSRLAVMIGLIALATFFWWQAVRRLSPFGEQHRTRIRMWTKVLSKRESFTDAGWRYRNVTVLCVIAFLAFAIFVGVP